MRKPTAISALKACTSLEVFTSNRLKFQQRARKGERGGERRGGRSKRKWKKREEDSESEQSQKEERNCESTMLLHLHFRHLSDPGDSV